MKLLPILFAMTLLFAILLVAADPDGYAQYSSTDLKTRVDAAKPDDHKVRLDRVANWGNHSLLAIRREGDGEAEVHDTQVDVIFVKSGEGTLILGGTVVEPRTRAPRAWEAARQVDPGGRQQEDARWRRHSYSRQDSSPDAGTQGSDIRS